jgi:hypothetical protein
MNTKSVFKMGFLSMIVATGLFGAANGFADTGHTTHNSEGVTANTGVKAEALEAPEDLRTVVADDVQIPETREPGDQVVVPEGNINRLTPPQKNEGKESGKRMQPFMPRTGLY